MVNSSIIERAMKNSDLMMAISVISLVVMMVIPLPSFLLSLLLSLNLGLALVVLLVSINTREPLHFSVFPSLILLATLFRLGLNVSSTRLILLDGYAGEVIEKFGAFVVGGNPVVGFIVFLILVVIQFTVITKGAERVAEVAARFTLDAMPGKQMSIDADLNAGLIDEKEARKRRRDIEREADFYGAMDGSSKFVKGDAIASVIITVINVVGGFIIGIMQQGMGWSEALERYTLLTVGDGLVTQIPALLLSTATGIIVTRAASEDDLSRDMTHQIVSHPRGLWIAAGALALMGILPGLPKIPFLMLALMLAGLGYVFRNSAWNSAAGEQLALDEQGESEVEKRDDNSPEAIARLLAVDPLEIELGYGLLSLADSTKGGDLMDRIGLARRQVATELGLIVPLVRVRDNMDLQANTYVIKLRGAELARGEIWAERFLALDPGGVSRPVPGLETKDPAFGLPARWIAPEMQSQAEINGYTVIEPVAVLVTHLTQLIRGNAHRLLGRQEVRSLLDAVRQTNSVVVDELVPSVLSTGEVQKVLQNLLREGVPIRDMVTILETLADWGPVTRDTDRLTEQARQALAVHITRDLPVSDNRLVALGVDPALEERIGRIQHGDHEAALDPETARRILSSLESEARKVLAKGVEPVVVSSPGVRFYLKRLIERSLPNLKVVSYAEISGDVQIDVVGVVKG